MHKISVQSNVIVKSYRVNGQLDTLIDPRVYSLFEYTKRINLWYSIRDFTMIKNKNFFLHIPLHATHLSFLPPLLPLFSSSLVRMMSTSKATKDGHIRSLLIVLFDSDIDDSTNTLYIIFFFFFRDLNLLQIALITTGSIINFAKFWSVTIRYVDDFLDCGRFY